MPSPVEPVDLERGLMVSLAQTYTLPPVVSSKANSYKETASRIAMAASVFAAVLGILASASISSPVTSNWSYLLRAIVYAGIISNSGTVVLALVFMSKASDLPSAARKLLLMDGGSLPRRMAHGAPLNERYLSSPSRDRDFELMMQFGMETFMLPLWRTLCFSCYLGGGAVFAALGVLLWMNENPVLATTLTVLTTVPAGCLLLNWLIREWWCSSSSYTHSSTPLTSI